MALPEQPLINPRHIGQRRDAADGFKRVIMRLEARMDALEAMFNEQRNQAIDVAKLEARLNALEPKRKTKSKKYDPMDDRDETVSEPPMPGQG